VVKTNTHQHSTGCIKRSSARKRRQRDGLVVREAGPMRLRAASSPIARAPTSSSPSPRFQAHPRGRQSLPFRAGASPSPRHTMTRAADRRSGQRICARWFASGPTPAQHPRRLARLSARFPSNAQLPLEGSKTARLTGKAYDAAVSPTVSPSGRAGGPGLRAYGDLYVFTFADTTQRRRGDLAPWPPLPAARTSASTIVRALP